MTCWIGVLPILAVLTWVGWAIFNRKQRKADWSGFKSQWAVVTGASEGIGGEYAKQLAKLGMNVVIVSRSMNKLEQIAKDVRAAGVQCKAIAFDFFSELAGYDALAAQLKDLTITVLVNNVGGSGVDPLRHNTESTKLFIDRDIADADKTLLLNTRPLITMTRIIGDQMRRQKTGGRIINISSLAGVVALPYSSTYSGTKAFTDAFTRSLAPELAQFNIRIEAHAPGNIQTSGNPMPLAFDCLPVENYVEASLRMFGTGNVVFPLTVHAVQATLLRALPEAISLRVLFNKRLNDKKKAQARLAELSGQEKKSQ